MPFAPSWVYSGPLFILDAFWSIFGPSLKASLVSLVLLLRFFWALFSLSWDPMGSFGFAWTCLGLLLGSPGAAVELFWVLHGLTGAPCVLYLRKYHARFGLLVRLNGIIRSRCSMNMWCPDGIGRDSWDRGEPASVIWPSLNSPQEFGGRNLFAE